MPDDIQAARLATDNLPALERWRQFGHSAFTKARRDGLLIQSAALAFITTVSLVPLLASFSFVGARLFSQDKRQWVEGLSRVLPYSEAEILSQLQVFLEQASAIRGIGFALFILSSLAVFTAVEKTFNSIWLVSRNRSLRTRLTSLAMVLFWGSLSFAATYSSLLEISNRPSIQAMTAALPFDIIPFVVSLLGLTMLYWLVPNTSVRWSSALAGGSTAALLLQILRQGFGFFVEGFQQNMAIYSSFAFALYFMISIQLTWWIVLLGCEVAYCAQNSRSLLPPKKVSPPEDAWLGLATLVLASDRLREGEPLLATAWLAENLHLLPESLRDSLLPLLRKGWLKEAQISGEDGFLLSCDPYGLPLRELFALYEEEHEEWLPPVATMPGKGLESLRKGLWRARARYLGDQTLADLFRHEVD